MKLLPLLCLAAAALGASASSSGASEDMSLLDTLPTFSAKLYLLADGQTSLRLQDSRESNLCELIAPAARTQQHRGLGPRATDVFVQRKPAVVELDREAHDGFPRARRDGWELVEVFGRDERVVNGFVDELCQTVFDASADDASFEEEAADEVIPIIRNGNPSNRVDMVFMGDGYTAGERGKLIDDIQRLTRDMFSGETFRTVLPLLNIWLVFRESKESGIGVGGKPKDTAFGLYRDGTELRGIYTSKASAARAACKATGTDACDYPSLIGNDLYYGGLGGEFVISTSSPTSGTIVLRHEQGHSMIDVGEEYDGGSVYSGVNAASSVSGLGWKHWLTSATAREEKNALLLQKYAWYDLAKGTYSASFTSDGTYKRYLIQLTASGVETQDSFKIKLDGVELPWKTTGILDRGFHDWFSANGGFAKGTHKIEVTGTAPKAGNPIRQLCSLTVHEFGGEDTYSWDNSVISAYPTYSTTGKKTYRPTNEFCLMRNMTSTQFCPVCKEGLWLSLLSRVALVEGVQTFSSLCNSTTSPSSVGVVGSFVPLGDLREAGSRVAGESLAIRWYKSNVEQVALRGQTSFTLPQAENVGTWKVEAELTTPEIRKDSKGYTKTSRSFEIKSGRYGC